MAQVEVPSQDSFGPQLSQRGLHVGPAGAFEQDVAFSSTELRKRGFSKQGGPRPRLSRISTPLRVDKLSQLFKVNIQSDATRMLTAEALAMLIGYARVSSDDQNLNLQKDALTRAGCERILEDRQSGAKADRPGLRDALDYARDGDTLTVWRLDRLSRSLKDLIDLVSQLEARGIGLKSLHESIDTTSSSGKLIFHVFGALAEFERNLIRERTQAGLAAARARGRRGGRPKSLDAAKRAIAVNLYGEKKHSVKEICEVMGVSKPTLYKYIQAARTETT